MRQRAKKNSRWVVLIASHVIVAGCGDERLRSVDEAGATDADTEEGVVVRESPATVRFDLPPTGSIPFLSVPFPSDVYRDDAGRVDIGRVDLEFANAPPPVTGAVETLNGREGFCRTCTVTFLIDGELQRDTVPGDSAPSSTPNVGDDVLLLRADTGELVPLLVDYTKPESAIVLRPRWDQTLEPGTTYVAALTDGILAADGGPLIRDERLDQLLADDGAGKRGHELYRRGMQQLSSAGVDVDRVAGLTVFTTTSRPWHMQRLRTLANSTTPSATFERIHLASDGSLDELLGVPTADRPGVDVRGEDGNWSIVHDAIDAVVLGHFFSPRIVEGQGTDIGFLRQSADGSLTPSTVPERVPFVLAIPAGADLSSLPVVIAHHGFPSTRRFGLQIANTFCRLGMAVLSFDAFQMGFRADTARDELNEFRGTVGADGFAEHDGRNVVLRMTGVAGADPARIARVEHTLAAASQQILDGAVAVRLVQAGELSALRSGDPMLSELGFDPERVYWLGQSFGGHMGLATLPITSGVRAGALYVGPPDQTEHLCNGPDNRNEFEPFVRVLLGVEGAFGPDRRACFHPFVDLLRWLLEPVSPIAMFRYMLDDRLDAGPPPDLLLTYVTYDELLGQVSGDWMLGVSGFPVDGPTMFVDPPELTFPASGNRETAFGPVTVAGMVFEANHSLLRNRVVRIDYEKPIVPPFVEADPPLSLENNIAGAHRQVGHFFETNMTSGRAEVIAP